MPDEPHPPPPPEAPPPRIGGLFASIGLTLGVMVVYFRLQGSVPRLFPALARPGQEGLGFALATLAAALVGILLVFLLVRGAVRLRRGRPVRGYLGLSLPTLAQGLGALAPLAAYNLLYDQVARLLGRPMVPDYLIEAYRSAGSLPLFYLAVVVAAPAFEELLFRGFLLPGLTPALGRVGGAIVSSAIFGLLHVSYDPFDMTHVFALGLLLAAVRLATRSTPLTFGMHATMNLIALVDTAVVVARLGG